jgi:hypothetical protein
VGEPDSPGFGAATAGGCRQPAPPRFTRQRRRTHHVEPAQVNATVLVPPLISMPVDTRVGFGALKRPIDPN